ncbi:MAG: NAD-dependent deacylase [Anaerolineae bacterium]|jgi:NAD-dependent deacetylase|nr:NAD-dependent deacylase [Anaerolineae bacterium]
MKIPKELIKYLQKSTHIAILTGAGISAESGLNTFREAQTGFWSQYRPEDLATPQAFARDPKLVWDWYAMRRNKVAEASSNSGHFALVDMESRTPNFTLITQNVDGYHVQAGSKNVLELHGNIQKVRCFDGCGIVDDWEDNSEVPHCPKCNAYLRPDVVWFGESLPLDALNAAHKATLECQAFFSVGTSGLVQPAASLAHTARQKGAIVIEINLDPTPLTPHVDFALHGKSGEILPALVKETWG